MTHWPAEFDELLRGFLALLPAGEPVPSDQRLTELGLDSMSTVNLLFSLERAFCVEFPDEVLTADTFATAKSLWAVLSGLRSEQG